MAKPMEWYGVKSIYSWHASGKPKNRDKDYKSSTVLFEERIILVRARSFDEAIRKAEKEAAKYAKLSHENPYGERVKAKCTKYFDAFKLFDTPGDLVEVYSVTEVLTNKKELALKANAHEAKDHGRRERLLRKRFQHR